MIPKEVQEIIDNDDTSVFNYDYQDEILEDWNYSVSCLDDEDWENVDYE